MCPAQCGPDLHRSYSRASSSRSSKPAGARDLVGPILAIFDKSGLARMAEPGSPMSERVDELQSALSTATERVEARLMSQAEAINRLVRAGRSTNRRLDAADR